MLVYNEAKEQFKSMEVFHIMNVKGRAIRLFSESQIDILLDVIYERGLNSQKKPLRKE